MGELLLGVDLGTTGTRTALFTPAGEELACETAETPLRRHGPVAFDQDPEDFYRGAVRTVRACLDRSGRAAGDVAAIGIAGQMAGVMGIDKDWRPSTPYDSWLDTRCAGEVARLKADVRDQLVERTGCPPMVNHAPKMRWWRREHPEAFGRTARFVMPGGYVAGRLAGLRADAAFIDRTYLHFTGVADARTGAWCADLARAVGVPMDKLPRIVQPWEVVGRLTAQAAGDCGLPPGVPIVAGLGDTAAGALGAGIVRPHQLLDVAGTAAVFAASTAEFRPDREERTLIIMHGALPDQWISLAYLSGGSLLEWFHTAVERAAGDGGEVDYEAITAGLDAVPAGAEGLLFVPHLDGRILPSDPALHGAWVGLTRRHDRRHLVRSILESVGYEYAVYLRVLRSLHAAPQLSETRVVGGGARSPLWNRIKASVLGVSYLELSRKEPGCWGAALVAGYGVGLFDDLAAAAAGAAEVRRRFEPDESSQAVYQTMTARYEATLRALSSVSGADRRDERGRSDCD